MKPAAGLTPFPTSCALTKKTMANISIKLSQSVVDTTNKLFGSTPANANGQLGSTVDGILIIDHLISTNYPTFTSWSLVGSTLRLGYADGASRVYTGVSLADSNATQGTATATGMEFYKNGLLSYATTGATTFNYSVTGTDANARLSLSPQSGTVNAIKVATLISTSSAAYNADVGNQSFLLNGNVTVDAANNIRGTITQFSIGADKFLASEVVTGNFQVSGNATTVGQGLSQSTVTGELTGIKVSYRDGSLYDINNISTTLSAAQRFDYSVFADPARFGGADVINLDLPTRVFQDFTMASGAGDDQILLRGGGGRLNVLAGEGNDIVASVTGTHFIDSGPGQDTVQFVSPLKSSAVVKSGSGYQIGTIGTQDITSVTNTERLQFADMSINLSIKAIAASLPAAQLLRLEELYVAFFNRVPDADGLAYWIGQFNAGQSLNKIADAFYAAGVQFSSLTGFSTTMSNADFVNVIYKNVLGRANGADVEGLSYWTGALASGNPSRGSLVSTILDSAHTYKNDPAYAYVANLLDNKGIVANKFAVTMGLNYNSAADSITHGIEIAAAVTPTDTTAAIKLIGLSEGFTIG